MTAALDAVAARAEAQLPGRVRRRVPSAGLTTYRCGGELAVTVSVEREADVVALSDAFAAAGASEVEVLVVGRGSNLLVADTGFDGLAVLLGGELDEVRIDDDRAGVDAGGAVALPVLARRAAAAGASGLEFYVGIPGSVGGAVKMNAGGHGAETDDVIVHARVVDLDAGRAQVLARPDLGLGYRTSAIGDRVVVTGATFRSTPDDPVACGARIDEIVRWRREHQPGGQNAGSVFTNPAGDAAGRLIEAAGCKGLRIGGAVVSEKHANFFVADAGATAADVYTLILEVRRRVADATGVVLEPELHLIGFESRDVDAHPEVPR